jgi:hypothetical protein
LLGLGCYLIVGGLVWASFARDKSYTQFETEFETASDARKKTRNVALFLYIVESIGLPFAVRVLVHNARIH